MGNKEFRFRSVDDLYQFGHGLPIKESIQKIEESDFRKIEKTPVEIFETEVNKRIKKYYRGSATYDQMNEVLQWVDKNTTIERERLAIRNATASALEIDINANARNSTTQKDDLFKIRDFENLNHAVKVIFESLNIGKNIFYNVIQTPESNEISFDIIIISPITIPTRKFIESKIRQTSTNIKNIKFLEENNGFFPHHLS